MCIKLPCKKSYLSHIASLLLGLALSANSIAIQADSARVEEQPVFWAIQKNGQHAGYLLGTIHSEDPRVLDFSADFLGKLKANQVFAMEMVPDLPTLARLTEYMQLPEGQTLVSTIGPERFSAISARLANYGVPVAFINRMKPWAVMMTLSTPPPETGFFMDLSLSLRASGNGLKVVGLETLEQQLSFLEEMPLEQQLSLLDQAIAEAGRVRQAHDLMVNAYLENNLEHLRTLSDEEFQSVAEEVRDYFYDAGIYARNQRMLESLLPHLEKHTVFVAVGALHLPGEKGLLSLLRQSGFELKPLAMPFSID